MVNIAVKLRFYLLTYSLEHEVVIKKKPIKNTNHKKTSFLLFVPVQYLIVMLIYKLDGYG